MKKQNIKEERVLPHSQEAEQCVMGCALIDVDACNEIMCELKITDFYFEAHKIIYENMLQVFNSNIPIDFVTIVAQLEKNNLLDSVGGVEYITDLTNVVPSASNFNHYVELVKRDSVLRQLISASNEIITNSFASINKSEAISFAESNIFTIAEREDRGGLNHVGDALNNVMDRFKIIQNDKDALKGISSGLFALDKITNGFHAGELIILAARPGNGKTSLGMNFLTHASINDHKKCALFSLEMSKEQIMQRALCSVGYVDMGKALRGELNAKDWESLWAAKQKLNDAKLFVDEGFSKSPADIISKCRRLQRKEGLDLVMIDYLQLMDGSSGKKNENKTNEIGNITRALKLAAMEMQIPIILLSQLSRNPEGRTGHKPMLSDLRESGNIEQDADLVLFIYRPDLYGDIKEKSKFPEGVSELIIAKHRNGEMGSVLMRWIGSIITFTNLDKDANTASLEKSAPANNTKTKANDAVNDEGDFTDSDAPVEINDENLDDIF